MQKKKFDAGDADCNMTQVTIATTITITSFYMFYSTHDMFSTYSTYVVCINCTELLSTTYSYAIERRYFPLIVFLNGCVAFVNRIVLTSWTS
eukprot:COSAG06_NODE_1099_length_10711_cov_145.571711_5_plen_92_part_00